MLAAIIAAGAASISLRIAAISKRCGLITNMSTLNYSRELDWATSMRFKDALGNNRSLACIYLLKEC